LIPITIAFGVLALLFVFLWWRTPEHVRALRVLYLLGAGTAAFTMLMWIVASIYLFPPIDAALNAAQ
jgi:hypothetical protein